MARVQITGDAEDMLFRVFDHSQGLQRRIFRMIARGHFNELGVEEMRQQAQGIINEIDALAKLSR